MAGDPKECRVHASRCAELAEEATSPQLKQTFIALSRNWLKLAIEVERNHALTDTDESPVKAR